MVLWRKKSGFTMVELLVVLAVSSIVFTLIYQAYRAQLKSHTTQQELVEMQQNLRAALYLMEREIRMAGYAPEGDPDVVLGGDAFKTIQISNMEFVMDSTSDEDTADLGEKIQYTIDGSGNLVRVSSDGGGGWRTDILIAAVDINSLEFVYMDADGADTLDPAAIRTVEIILSANIGTTAMVDPHQMELRSEVKVRNLGLNLNP